MNDSTLRAIPTSIPNRGLLRERFEAEKDSVIDSGCSKQESWAKKVGAGTCGVLLDDIPKLLDTLGLKLVDRHKICVNKDVYAAYKALATAAITNPTKLDWDGE